MRGLEAADCQRDRTLAQRIFESEAIVARRGAHGLCAQQAAHFICQVVGRGAGVPGVRGSRRQMGDQAVAKSVEAPGEPIRPGPGAAQPQPPAHRRQVPEQPGLEGPGSRAAPVKGLAGQLVRRFGVRRATASACRSFSHSCRCLG